MNRYLIGFFALIGLTILFSVLLLTSHSKSVTPPKTTHFSSYTYSNSQVQVIIDGPIVAPQNHDTAIITVNKDNATFNLIKGYDGDVVNTKIFNNTQNSYKNFLYALYYAGYTQGQASKAYPTDVGLCSTGNRYDYFLSNNGKNVTHYWVTNCAGVKTYLGDQYLTLNLFESQIPDINTLATGSNIGL